MKEDIDRAIKNIEKDIELSKEGEGFYTEVLCNKEDLENLLTRYKQLEEENKELLEVKISASAHNRIMELEEENKQLEAIKDEAIRRYNFESIPVSKVKEILNKEKLPLTIVGGRRNAKTLEYGRKLGRIEVCKDLLGKE